MKRNIMKKIIISILVGVLSIFSCSVFAETDESVDKADCPRFIIKSVEAKQGGIAEVELSIKSPQSIASAALVIQFNKNLQFIEYSNEDAYSVKNMSNYEDGIISTVFVAQNGNIDADNREVKVCTLRFKVPDQVNSDDVLNVSIRNVKDMSDNNGKGVEEYFVENGVITVTDIQSSQKQNGANNANSDITSTIIRILLIIMWAVTIVILIYVVIMIVRKKGFNNTIENDGHDSDLNEDKNDAENDFENEVNLEDDDENQSNTDEK